MEPSDLSELLVRSHNEGEKLVVRWYSVKNVPNFQYLVLTWSVHYELEVPIPFPVRFWSVRL